MSLAEIIEFLSWWTSWGSVWDSISHLLRAMWVADLVHQPSTHREVPWLLIATCWRKLIHCQKNVSSSHLWIYCEEQWKLISQWENFVFPWSQSVLSADNYLIKCLKSSTCSFVACLLIMYLQYTLRSIACGSPMLTRSEASSGSVYWLCS